MDELTVSYEEEEPPFLGDCAEDYHQEQVQHDSLTQHPAEGGQEQVVEQHGHKQTSTLYGHCMYVYNCSCVIECMI